MRTVAYPGERPVPLTGRRTALLLALLVAGNVVTAIGWAVRWGVCVSLPVVPQQSRLVAHAPTASAVLLGLNNSAIYLGIALGGLLQESLTPARLRLAAAGVNVAGLVVTLTTIRRPGPAPALKGSVVGYGTSLEHGHQSGRHPQRLSPDSLTAP